MRGVDPVNENLQIALTHALCLAMLGASFWLSGTVLAPYPEVGRALVAGMAGLYGKLAFKPLQAVIERTLLQLSPEQLRKALRHVESTRPPAPDPNDDYEESPQPFPKSPSARPGRDGGEP